MRKIKKLLSTLLVLAVVVNGYPSVCTAADTTTQTDVDTTVDYGRKPDDSYIHRSTGGKKSQTMSSNDYSKEAGDRDGTHSQVMTFLRKMKTERFFASLSLMMKAYFWKPTMLILTSYPPDSSPKVFGQPEDILRERMPVTLYISR